ncbi:DUF732 domain-containing protein [Mycobacterium sp.]|uniref:DUF732 domain-containing protein n=1 Tax=Mycobacterium sp. TaxID=1785 RepID=UPI0031D09E61
MVLTAGLAAAAIGLAVPAHADRSGDDAGFLSALDHAGITHRGADRAVSAGHAVCELMDGGMSPVDTVVAVQSTNPGFTAQHAATFAGLAAASYCPQHL